MRARHLPVRGAAAGLALLVWVAGCSAAPTGLSPGTAGPSGTRSVSASGSPSDDTPTRATSTTPTGSTCATPSLSGGPIASLVVVVTTAAGTAAGGATLPVKTEIVTLSDGPRVVARPQTSALEVLRGGVVVARTVGEAGPEVPTPISRGRTLPAQTVPGQVKLVGCDGSPLPAGAYTLRALLGYGGDPLNNAAGGSSSGFVLPSEPVDLTIT